MSPNIKLHFAVSRFAGGIIAAVAASMTLLLLFRGGTSHAGIKLIVSVIIGLLVLGYFLLSHETRIKAEQNDTRLLLPGEHLRRQTRLHKVLLIWSWPCAVLTIMALLGTVWLWFNIGLMVPLYAGLTTISPFGGSRCWWHCPRPTSSS
jgi:hypothetical protein